MAARNTSAIQVSDRWVVAVTVGVLLASTTLLPLTQDSGYLILSSVLVVILGAVTFVLRRFRVGDVPILGFQFLTLAGFSFAASLGMEAGKATPSRAMSGCSPTRPITCRCSLRRWSHTRAYA